MLKALTLEDQKVMAEQCNEIGERAKEAGLQLGHHNHNVEFKPLPGGAGYDNLLRLPDPKLVKLELDCGWMRPVTMRMVGEPEKRKAPSRPVIPRIPALQSLQVADPDSLSRAFLLATQSGTPHNIVK
jgi:hypothetical protein